MHREYPNDAPPYPTLTRDAIVCDDRLLRRLYLPFRDELVAVSDYIYWSLITEESFPEASELFNRIAMDEMRHYRFLGRAISLLGGNPVIRTSIHPKAIKLPPMEDPVKRTDALLRILNDAVRSEEYAQAEYDRLSAFDVGGVLPVLFCRIATDESSHIRELRTTMETYA